MDQQIVEQILMLVRDGGEAAVTIILSFFAFKLLNTLLIAGAVVLGIRVLLLGVIKMLRLDARRHVLDMRARWRETEQSKLDAEEALEEFQREIS
jgi:hypothetical protein